MNKSKVMSALLATTMLTGTVTPVLAVEQNEVVGPLPNTGSSIITLEVKDQSGGGGGDTPGPDPGDVIIATVPIELPIIMDLKGNITVPTNAVITNHVKDKDIKVRSINTQIGNDWVIANFSDDFTTKTENSKEIGLSFREDTLSLDGTFSLTANNWNITADSSLNLNMRAKIPVQTVESKGEIATVVFELDWNTSEVIPEVPTNTVTYKSVDNAQIVTDNLEIKVERGKSIDLPVVKVTNADYEFNGWIDEVGNTVTSPFEPTADTQLTPTLVKRQVSNEDWFVTNGTGSITGLSADFSAMTDKPSELVIPSTVKGEQIKSIGDMALKRGLFNRVVISEGIETIGFSAFSQNINAEEIILPSTLTNIGMLAFGSCSSLEAIDIPTSVSIVGDGAFSGCTKLKELKLPDSVVLPLGSNVIEECKSLETLILPSSLELSEYGFYRTFSICIPTDKEYNSSSLTNILINNSNRYKSVDGILYNKDGTKLVGYPSGRTGTYTIDNKVTTIGASSIKNCRVSEVIIPDSVTTIEANAFEDSQSIENLVIPDSVTSIGEGAFTNVKHITYNGTATGAPWGAISIN